MWRPSLATDGNRSTNRKITARPSSSSSSFSRSSSSSSVAVPQTPKRKTMEEVWKDINLATTAHDSRPPQAAAGQRNFHSMMLQDFLAGAFKSPPSAAASGELPQFTLAPTALNLRSEPASPPNFSCHAAASSLFSSAKKRILYEAPSCVVGGDRHHKRMMKNRESAARSRARKQARILAFFLSSTC